MPDLETCRVALSVRADEFGKEQGPSRPGPGPAPSLWPSEALTLAVFSQQGPFSE